MRISLPSFAIFLMLGILFSGLSPVLGADDPEQKKTEPANLIQNSEVVAEKRKELENLSSAIRLSNDRINELERDVEQLAQDRETLREALIQSTKDAQDFESKLTGLEQSLVDLSVKKTELSGKITDRRQQISKLLIVLQRMSRQPPPALLVRPEDVTAAVRGSGIVAALIPDIADDAAKLNDDLLRLATVEETIKDRKELFLATQVSELEEKTRLTALIAKKKKLENLSLEQLKSERTRVASLGSKATDLRGLIGELDAERKRVERERQREIEEQQSQRNKAAAYSDPKRIKAQAKFADAKGLVRLPVRGVILQRYGADDEFGNPASGITIGARKGAQISAPFDSWVRYAGSFRSYGKLVILDAGDGYQIVLAGLEYLSVSQGQFVLTGEPIGQLGRSVLVSRDSQDTLKSGPQLYIELRKDGLAIDSTQWWTTDTFGKASG